jgi:hypothetical protein
VLALALCALPAAAQARYRTTRTDAFRQQPGADQKVLASIARGTLLAGGRTQDGWIEVTLEGWIWARSVARTTRDGFALAVSPPQGENLRAAPNGPIIARLAGGFLLDEVRRDAGGWVLVRRTGWMRAASLEAAGGSLGEGTGAASGAGVETGTPAQPVSSATLDRAVTARAAELKQTPDGPPLGSLAADAPVKVLARSGEWVRVQAEGWVREEDLRPRAPGVLVGVSGAEVRARPADFEGKVVQWRVQYLALQIADEIRREMPVGQQYLLARGPLPEAGFVYVLLTGEQAQRIGELEPLSELVIVARIKVARSQYLGNPVVELLDLAVRQP